MNKTQHIANQANHQPNHGKQGVDWQVDLGPAGDLLQMATAHWQLLVLGLLLLIAAGVAIYCLDAAGGFVFEFAGNIGGGVFKGVALVPVLMFVMYYGAAQMGMQPYIDQFLANVQQIGGGF